MDHLVFIFLASNESTQLRLPQNGVWDFEILFLMFQFFGRNCMIIKC